MPYETIDYKNYKIVINHDDPDFNPREENENLGTMYCFHSRYKLGDEHNLTRDEVLEMARSNKCIALPLYLYDHSGITMNTTGFSCDWDSGQVGFIIVSKDQIRNDYGWKKITKEREQKIQEYLKDEVKTYDHFLTGNTFYYTVKKGDKVIDTRGIFYGTDFEKNGLLEGAREDIDNDIQETFKREGQQMTLPLLKQ